MALLTILEYPDPRLRRVAAPVQDFDDQLRRLTEDMLETMYEADGIGLAATQVDVHKQVIVMDISEGRDEPRIFINPLFEVVDETLDGFSEGCLSVPGFFENVERPRRVRVRYRGLDGEQLEIEPEGLLAVCIQHEMDHLKGKLFVDHISDAKRLGIRRKLEKKRRRAS